MSMTGAGSGSQPEPPETAGTTAGAEAASDVANEYGPPVWTDLWDAMGRTRTKIANGYERGSDPETLKADMMVFFILCWNLRDWIMTDDTVPFGKDLMGIETKVPCMRRCWAVANTANQRATAGVQGTVIHHNSRASIRFTEDPTDTVDALELADECLLWWRTYLRAHGLTAR
ncbi:hypothetical protein [Arthrobacter sedimenti]|uniref:Uncharacterized protein n=1 Tax=Arthrobacter sedimenti TaxID=2694931 RepID=A0ABV8WNB2_9MICC